ncbi:MAG: methylaspartate ammonia-lyase [Negativicutes bacterium]|jgi:methylaspartate ammonia-lyase
MKILDVICARGISGFYYDDLKAIRAGAEPDGFTYTGKPKTQNYCSVRQAGEAVSVMIILENGDMAYGDCSAVQYSGTFGRYPVFLADAFIPIINRDIRPALISEELDDFRRLAKKIEAIRDAQGLKLHPALRYGVTQALLAAVARSKKKLMCEIVAEEYHHKVSEVAVPITAQSGADIYSNADKMIIKQVPIIPQGLFNNGIKTCGKNGERLLEYIAWLRKRVAKLRSDDLYVPVFHLVLHGSLSQVFYNDIEQTVEYLKKMAAVAAPFRILVEDPVELGDADIQLGYMKKLMLRLSEEDVNVKIIVDEWCNTLEDIKAYADAAAADIIHIKAPDLGSIDNAIEAVLYCKDKSIGTYWGGSCNETDDSAIISSHIAMGLNCDMILAKPGMGVDEAYMMVHNEIQRILALRKICKLF